MVVDLAEPRNVDLSVAMIPGLSLRNLDDLRGVMRSGVERRLRETRRAEKVVERGVGEALLTMRQDRVEPLIASLFRDAEAIRKVEAGKAIARIGAEAPSSPVPVVEDLTRVLVKRILSGPVERMRDSAATGEFGTLDAAEKLFGAEATRPRHPSPKLGRRRS